MLNPSNPVDQSAMAIAQLQNWENFCQYHLGDWYGNWTKYSPRGETLESFQCVRSFHLSEDGTQIDHQNRYIYADGKSEAEVFGPYKKPITRALFLENSFSWGSTMIKPGAYFGFETGFRFEGRRASAVAMFDETGELQQLTIISEHLGSFTKELPLFSADSLAGNWQGIHKTMTPNWRVSSGGATTWKHLGQLAEEYLTLNFADGLSFSSPQQAKPEKEFFLAVDWLISPTLLQRVIRHFVKSGFTNFTLQTFTRES